jgi:GAF domain-containing protein
VVDPSLPLAQEDAQAGDSAALRDLAGSYAELQRLLLDTSDLREFLQNLADLAASVIPDGSCAVTMRRSEGEVATVANSDGFAARVDEIQYSGGEGPCLESLGTNREVLVNDLVEDDRWPDYRVHAIAHGVRSSLSLPLSLGGGDTAIGALNLYGRRPGLFQDGLVEIGRSFGQQASVALTIAVRNVDQEALQSQLRDALTFRAVIDQAMGILMGQRRITAAAAFAVLREASQHQNRRMRDIAADLVSSFTGQAPETPRPFTDRR